MDTELTQAALDCARTAFGGVSIVATATLRDRPGWSVERLALVTGTGASVADRLMGDDPGEATAAVQRWAEAVARIQAATLRMGTDFRSRLAALAATARPDGGADVYRDRLGPQRAVGWKVAVTRPASDEVIADAFGGLRDGRAPLGVTAGPDALAELRAIAGRLRADSAGLHGPGALTPGDTCPDNNVETPELWTWPSIAMYLEMAGWRFDRPGRGAHGSAAPAETPPRR